jgi:hypothetical protein
MTLKPEFIAMTAEEAVTFADAIAKVSIRVNQAENLFALLDRLHGDGDYQCHHGLEAIAAFAAEALGALGNAELDTLNKLSNRLTAG